MYPSTNPIANADSDDIRATGLTPSKKPPNTDWDSIATLPIPDFIPNAEARYCVKMSCSWCSNARPTTPIPIVNTASIPYGIHIDGLAS